MSTLDTPPSRLVSVDEAKQQLRASTSLLYKLMRQNELRRVKIGGKAFLLQSDIDAFIDRQVADLPSLVAV